MPEMIDLLSDFTRTNVDWLRRTTATRHVPLSSEELSQFAVVCECFAVIAEGYRDLVRAVLKQGIEAGTLNDRLRGSMAFLSDGMELMEELQRRADSVSPLSQPALEQIRRASARTRAVCAYLNSLLTLANLKPPPIPEDTLRAAEAGPFIRLDEFRKRKETG